MLTSLASLPTMTTTTETTVHSCVLSAEGYTVTVDGLVPNRLELSIDALTHDFSQHSVTCALQCAGNRRHAMRTRIKEVQGIDWLDGAIMNCR